MKPTLYIFAGLPGAGKTTLARTLAQKQNAAYLRIDIIEQAIKDYCAIPVETAGYCLAYRIATENLSIGISVVVDSCNCLNETRNAFESIAHGCNSDFLNIEIVCSDALEHKHRIELRSFSTENMHFQTWQHVVTREYHAWNTERVVIDTAGRTESDAFQELYKCIIQTMSPTRH